MGRTLKQILSDSSLPVPYSVRRFTCAQCFNSFESVYYTAEAMNVIYCDGCGEWYYFSHRSKRLFNWDKSKAMPVDCFIELDKETILRA